MKCATHAWLRHATLAGLCGLGACIDRSFDASVEVRPIVARDERGAAGARAPLRHYRLPEPAWLGRPNRTRPFDARHDAGLDTDAGAAGTDAMQPEDANQPSQAIDGSVADSGGSAADAEIADAGVPDAEIPDPASCMPWTATVDPGPGVRCVQEPPLDVGPFGGRVALTFDDGPNPATTPLIVAILREQGIPATFFMTGSQLEQPAARAIALDVHRDPLFRVANHTYTHPQMPALSLAAAQLQIEDTTAALQAAVNDPCYFPRFFRFPFSAASCETVLLVRERGLAVTGVHIDPVDWCYALDAGYCSEANAAWLPAAYRDDMVSLIVSQLDRYQGGIVLMHDIHANTAAMLPAVIAALRDAGMQFVALDDATVFPLLNAEVAAPEPPACCNGVVR